MRILTLAVVAAGAAGLLLSAATSADAAPRKKSADYYTGDRVYTPRTRPRARIAVRPRSYLDAGTEVLPGERKFTEYAIPYGYSPLSNLGPSFGWDRRPFNDPWDAPSRYGW
jgi:hypothetical protein